MKLARHASGIAFLMISGAAVAADMLPLKQGIYVPVASACKGASNAETVNYWGGNSGIGVSQAECTIKKLAKKGNVYTFLNRCTDIQSGDLIAGGATVLTIISPTRFKMSGTLYRFCGTEVQF